VGLTVEPGADRRTSTTGRTLRVGFARARAFFAAHGITRIVRVISDNGSNYRAAAFSRTVITTASRHQWIRPYTPWHNGKVERYRSSSP
jgi:transposase InsO family protein